MSVVSTGSTAKVLAEAGVAVTPVSDVTGFPEAFDGRVKTLHPLVHGGLLADRRKPAHVAQLEELGVEAFDLVVVNLYPFRETVAAGADADETVEQIDIGGPAMVRASAKNFANVAVVVSPARYADVVRALADGGFDLVSGSALAAEAFAHTATYDMAVASWMKAQLQRATPRTSVARPASRPGSAVRGSSATSCATARTRTRRPRSTSPRRRSRSRAGDAAARQADVLQQLRRHRRRPARGATTSTSPASRSSSTPTRAASPSARASRTRRHRRGAPAGARLRPGLARSAGSSRPTGP